MSKEFEPNKILYRILDNVFRYDSDLDKEKFAKTLIEQQSIIIHLEKAIDKMAEHIVELQNTLFDLDMLKEYRFATTKEDIIKYYKGESKDE